MQVKAAQGRALRRKSARDFIISTMSVIALGLNHSTAPLDLRGRFAFAPEQLSTALHGFRERIRAARPARGGAAVHLQPHRAVLRRRARPRPATWCARPSTGWRRRAASAASACCDHTYVLEDRAAARHAFRVASGLDSMVLGEPQILGQMKEAVRQAESAGTLGTHAAPAVPALVLGGQGGAQLHRDRQPFDQHGRGLGAAGVAAVRGPGRDPRALRRRRRDDRTGGHALRGAPAQGHGGGQPHARARREAGQPLRRAGAAPGRPAAACCTSTTRWCPAPPAACRSSAWARSSGR